MGHESFTTEVISLSRKHSVAVVGDEDFAQYLVCMCECILGARDFASENCLIVFDDGVEVARKQEKRERRNNAPDIAVAFGKRRSRNRATQDISPHVSKMQAIELRANR